MGLIIALLAGTTHAWTSVPKNSFIQEIKSSLENVAKGTVAIGVAASLTSAVIIGPSIANAADFTGSYSDPNHPNCARLVAIEGETALIMGADGNPGCPTGEGRPWKLVGKASGDNIFVDFSPKGGPKDLKGVWEAKPPGIRWPDGNKWTLEGRP